MRIKQISQQNVISIGNQKDSKMHEHSSEKLKVLCCAICADSGDANKNNKQKKNANNGENPMAAF